MQTCGTDIYAMKIKDQDDICGWYSLCLRLFELQEHAVVRLQANAGAQHVLQHRSLLAEGIDDWGALWHNRRLLHRRENQQYFWTQQSAPAVEHLLQVWLQQAKWQCTG